MTEGAHDAGGGFGRSAGANAGRGIAVIVGAVILGLFLMARGVDDSDLVAAEDPVTTTTVSETDSGDAASTTEQSTTITTAAPAVETTLGAQRDPAEVLTLALNGTDPVQGGVASKTRDVLQASGYGTAAPKNAETVGPSVVLFVEGYESDARAIAAVFGADPAVVVKPFDAATSPIADTQGAQVIVMAGNDGVILP